MPTLLRLARLASAGVAVVAALAACDAQEGDGYVGEPIARLTGPVVDARDEPTEQLPSDLVVTLMWLSGPDGPERGEPWSFERTRVEAGFPARFTLDIIAPPPAELLEVYGLALGMLLVHVSTDDHLDEVLPGLARDNVLLYLDDRDDLTELVTDEVATRLGVPEAEPGLNLMDVVAPDDPPEEDGELASLRPAADGLATEVVIELVDPDAQLPNLW